MNKRGIVSSPNIIFMSNILILFKKLNYILAHILITLSSYYKVIQVNYNVYSRVTTYYPLFKGLP